MVSTAEDVTNKRYRVDQFHASSLEGNPLNAPTDRDIAIYLPPDYFEKPKQRYPVIYYLHGYSGNNRSFTVYPTLEANPNLPVAMIPPPILEQFDLDRLASYDRFDELIRTEKLAPLIFVQPDGSLHKPHKDGLKTLRGEHYTKGSFYVNSLYTGNYEDYILEVIQYVDANYRTVTNRTHRMISGGSMGGYGALRIALSHPHLFNSCVSLSPGDFGLVEEMYSHKLRIPLYEALMGAEFSANFGDAMFEDILDTLDLIWSKDRPLLPTIERDSSGNVVAYDSQAAEKLIQGSILTLLDNLKSPLSDELRTLRIYLSCATDDEFGLAIVTKALNKKLEEMKFDVRFNLYDDPKAKLTPHILGIGYEILPAIHFCLEAL